MLGRAIQRQLANRSEIAPLCASHRPLPGFVHLDYPSLASMEAWSRVLADNKVDAVINCVGIWKGSPSEFEHIQFAVPAALFRACAISNTRVVHISALGFSATSPLPYVSTKARADEVLLTECPSGVVVYPSLVFGAEGNSSRFFMRLAALPVQVDFGFAQNLQPVHETDVARVVVEALLADAPPKTIVCAGPSPTSIPEYFDALRKGMGLRPAWLKLKVPQWLGNGLFQVGEAVRAHFVNRQTWLLLKDGTCDNKAHPEATPYESFASPKDALQVAQHQLYWAARLSVAAIWLWTAVVTLWGWPHAESLGWLRSLWAPLGTEGWLTTSALLDAIMGVLALGWASKLLWKTQFGLVAAYSIGLLYAVPAFALHPFGPLSKNLAVLVTLACLALSEERGA